MLGLTINEFAMSMGIDWELYAKFEVGEYEFSNDITKEILSNLYIEKEDLGRVSLDSENIEEYITNISMKVIEECEKGE